MSFIRIRTINGQQYRYLEERYREGGKVRSRSKYLGRVLGVFTPIPREERGLRYIGKLMEKYPTPPVEQAKAVDERLMAGMRPKMSPDNPVPVEKVSVSPSASAPASAPQSEQSAGNTGTSETSSESG
jgi:hypothetical protein